MLPKTPAKGMRDFLPAEFALKSYFLPLTSELLPVRILKVLKSIDFNNFINYNIKET